MARVLWICVVLIGLSVKAHAQAVPPAELGPARWQWARAFGYPYTEYLGPNPKITAMVSDTVAKKVYVGFQSAPYIHWFMDTYKAGAVAQSDVRFDSVWSGIACFREDGGLEWVYPLAGDSLGGPDPRGETGIKALALDAASQTLLAIAYSNDSGVVASDSSFQVRTGRQTRVHPPSRNGYPLPAASFALALSTRTGAMRWIREGTFTPFHWNGTGFDPELGSVWTGVAPGPSGSFYVLGTTTDNEAYFGGEPGLAGSPPGWLEHTGQRPAWSPMVLKVDARSGHVRASRCLASNEGYQIRSSNNRYLLPAPFGREMAGVCLPLYFKGRLAAAPGDTLVWDPGRDYFAHALVFLDSGLNTTSRLLFENQRAGAINLCTLPGGRILAKIAAAAAGANATFLGGELHFPPSTGTRPTDNMVEIPATGQASDARILSTHERPDLTAYIENAMLAGPDGGTLVAGSSINDRDINYGMTVFAGLRYFPLLGIDSTGARVWALASDTVSAVATTLCWASGRRLWLGGQVGYKAINYAFTLYRGRVWPLALAYTGGQNFLGLSEPIPSLSPIVANRPRLASRNAAPLQLYPNPARGSTIVSGPALASGQVLDLQGRKLMSFRLDQNGSGSLSLQSLKPGLYLIHCQQQTVKLVVE